MSLWFKMFSGIFEFVSAILVAFLTKHQIESLAQYLSGKILGSGIKDFIYLHIVNFLNSFDHRMKVFVVIYLAIHAIVKIVLVSCIFRKKIWAYKWMIIMLIVFIFYQVYEMFHKFSGLLVILTIVDLIVIVLTSHEYKRSKKRFNIE